MSSLFEEKKIILRKSKPPVYHYIIKMSRKIYMKFIYLTNQKFFAFATENYSNYLDKQAAFTYLCIKFFFFLKKENCNLTAAVLFFLFIYFFYLKKEKLGNMCIEES